MTGHRDTREGASNSPPAPVWSSMTPLSKDKHHGWKYIAFGPRRVALYVPVAGALQYMSKKKTGAMQPLCDMHPDQYAGSSWNIFDPGTERFVADTVGFDWHPDSEEKIW